MYDYRSYVGPPEDYDIIAALSFNLLTTLGLRGHHTLLDVGCGSLRIGRLLIPYLDRGNYIGVEPYEALIRDGLHMELGLDIMSVKAPQFYIRSTAAALPEGLRFDWALAQSIFSHTGIPLMQAWLDGVSQRLVPTGALIATFCPGVIDYTGSGWMYPACVTYQQETVAACAEKAGLGFKILRWPHPRQTWVLLSKPDFKLLRAA